MKRWQVRLWQGMARRLPRRLVYFTAIQLGADVTTQGKLKFVPVPDISMMDAIGDYAKRYRLEGK